MNQSVLFSDRLKSLRGERGWSQTELAEHADLAPAALSRILGGTRRPRMEHLIALASALKVTVIELVAGTDLQDTIQEWVPRSRFEQVERDHLDAVRDKRITVVELSACQQEVASLRESINQLTRHSENLEHKLLQTEASARRAEHLSKQVSQLQVELVDTRSELKSSRERTRHLHTVSIQESNRADRYHKAYADAVAHVEYVQNELSRAHGAQIGVGVVSAILGGVGGALLASQSDPTVDGTQ